MPEFNHHDLTLLNPTFDSPLVDVVNELEHLRRLVLSGDTPAPIFFQLKTIFHMLESLGSARIEGNHTTLADYVESKLNSGSHTTTDTLREMENIEAAMEYIEQHITPGDTLSEHFIRELHDMTVRELQREGDATPGRYRLGAVRIAQSAHLPPEAIQVPQYMQELVAFINEKQSPKYDLMKVALAHHRFGWIHPFSNGNGRVVRLLTYALLIKYGFNVKAGGRLLNPTAVFCNDRNHYYAMLAGADAGTVEGRETWCVYVLQGILHELSNVNRLTDYEYLSEKILMPTISRASESKLVTPLEAAILRIACKHGVAKAADFTIAMPDLSPPQKTYQIRKLVERKMLEPISTGARQYTIGFSSSYLMRSIIIALSDEGFIPATLSASA